MAATDGCDFESDTDSSIICVCVCVWKFQQNFLLFLETVFGFTSKTASVMGDFGFLNYSFFFFLPSESLTMGKKFCGLSANTWCCLVMARSWRSLPVASVFNRLAPLRQGTCIKIRFTGESANTWRYLATPDAGGGL